ncbi:hypothetical protein OF855_24715 [Mycolicibacterium fortuitum]|uniref:hypothetical protein n=1 Tax=Mycolicibacterium fortuitum TaxID=1766 RepID=UPI0022BA372E|nr:hypothetical protein [Mycolicibacterium fortuitum]WAY18443.1 hypothetical protein OF855_24715 [Mycolicibacterium fortuitum]
MLRDAVEMAEQYGWTDEAIAPIQAARDAGWTLQEIGEVLGCTREFARQLYERDVDPAVEIKGFPHKPDRPKKPKSVPANVLRRGLVSDDEIAELAEMARVAKYRRRGGNQEAAEVAEEFWRRIDHLVTLGVPHTWLSKRMGYSACTLRAGLARYGYRSMPPSQPQRRTGEAAS